MTGEHDRACIETILGALDYLEDCILDDPVFSKEEEEALAAIGRARKWIEGVCH